MNGSNKILFGDLKIVMKRQNSKKAIRKIIGRQQVSRIGAEMRLFLGLDEALEGYMHIKPPRNTTEYEEMPVSKLVRRVQDDIEELVARAYPRYQEEWAKKFRPEIFQVTSYPYSGRFGCIGLFEIQKIANNFRPGLYERLQSEDLDTRKQAYEEFNKLITEQDDEESKHAAKALAFAVKQAAIWLENLSVKRPQLMQEAAKQSNLWPVNLGVRKKIVNGKIQIEITRKKFAKNYLKDLGLNSDCRWPETERTGAQKGSPFHIAAQELYTSLLMMKHDLRFFYGNEKMTPWTKRLAALSEPMTKTNADDWWTVAKVWLDEQWELNKKVFTPLIRSLKMDSPIYTPSLKKRRVVDDSLKKAFKSLAVIKDL